MAAALEDLGLEVATPNGQEYSVEVPAGMVSSTDPDVGASVVRGTEVTINVSLGAKPTTVPDARRRDPRGRDARRSRAST